MDLSITIPDSAPTIGSKDDVLDLGKERELRTLRAKVATLEGQLAEVSTKIRPALSPRSLSDEAHRISKCGMHHDIEVSLETNSVTCKRCGSELVPMDVLRQFAQDERTFVHGLEYLRTEKKQLTEEVDKLKKQRASLRSQVRKKGGDVPDDPGATRPSTREYYKLLSAYSATRRELDALKKSAAQGEP